MHLHTRNPTYGRPDQSPEAFEPFLKVIKQSSNVVVNLTTGRAPFMTIEERVRPAEKWKPEERVLFFPEDEPKPVARLYASRAICRPQHVPRP